MVTCLQKYKRSKTIHLSKKITVVSMLVLALFHQPWHCHMNAKISPSTTFPVRSAVLPADTLAMYAPISPLVPGISFPPTSRSPNPLPSYTKQTACALPFHDNHTWINFSHLCICTWIFSFHS